MLMEPAFPTYLHNRHHRIPVLTGYNRGEMKMFSRMGGGMLPKTLAEYDAFAARYGGKEAEFRALCPVSTDEDVQELFQSAAFDWHGCGDCTSLARCRHGRGEPAICMSLIPASPARTTPGRSTAASCSLPMTRWHAAGVRLRASTMTSPGR